MTCYFFIRVGDIIWNVSLGVSSEIAVQSKGPGLFRALGSLFTNESKTCL